MYVNQGMTEETYLHLHNQATMVEIHIESQHMHMQLQTGMSWPTQQMKTLKALANFIARITSVGPV